MIKQGKPIPRSTREAADWFARLSDPKIETDALEAFSTWRAIPENRAAYERIEDLSRSLQSLANDPDMVIAANEAIDRGAKTKSVRRTIGLPPKRAWLGAVAAVGLLAALSASFYYWRLPTFSTGVGQTFSARLADGSRVQLNTDSQVRVRYSAGVRRVELLRGQAMFEVAHNPARPFVVAAGDTETRALGTRFEVRRIGEAVRVTLTQGSVEITDRDAPRATWRLTPGQALALPPRARAATKPVLVDVKSATSWTTGDLTFQDIPLADAVAELNRYTHSQIRLAPGVPGERRISGVFPAGENGDFVAAASSLYGLRSVAKPNGDIELQPRVL